MITIRATFKLEDKAVDATFRLSGQFETQQESTNVIAVYTLLKLLGTGDLYDMIDPKYEEQLKAVADAVIREIDDNLRYGAGNPLLPTPPDGGRLN